MVALDHRLVVVVGLVLSCCCYQVPLYAVLLVFLCGCIVYVTNKYNGGWRVAIGLNGVGFVRQARHARWRFSSSPLLSSDSGNAHMRDDSWTQKPTCEWKRTPTSSWQVSSGDGRRLLHASGSSPCFPSLDVNKTQTGYGRNFIFMNTTTSKEHQRNVEVSPATDGQTSLIHQPKFAGMGIYPFVQVTETRPTMLSHCNSTMVKNRVTVKVAPPKRHLSKSVECVNPASNVLENTFSSTNNNNNGAIKSNNRKRTLNDTGKNGTEKNVAKRRHRQDVASCVSPKVATTADFSDENTQPLVYHQSSAPPKIQNEPSQQLPKVIAHAHTNAIHSSFSSSRCLLLQKSTTKRKPNNFLQEAPESKIGRNDLQSPVIQVSTAVATESTDDDGDVVMTADVAVNTTAPDAQDTKTQDETSHKSNTNYSFHTTLTGAKSPMPVHIPNYIPNLEDYLEDKRNDSLRLKHLLGCFATKITDQKDVASSNLPEVNTGLAIVKTPQETDTFAADPVLTFSSSSSTVTDVTRTTTLSLPPVISTSATSGSASPSVSSCVANTPFTAGIGGVSTVTTGEIELAPLGEMQLPSGGICSSKPLSFEVQKDNTLRDGANSFANCVGLSSPLQLSSNTNTASSIITPQTSSVSSFSNSSSSVATAQAAIQFKSPELVSPINPVKTVNELTVQNTSGMSSSSNGHLSTELKKTEEPVSNSFSFGKAAFVATTFSTATSTPPSSVASSFLTTKLPVVTFGAPVTQTINGTTSSNSELENNINTTQKNNSFSFGNVCTTSTGMTSGVLSTRPSVVNTLPSFSMSTFSAIPKATPVTTSYAFGVTSTSAPSFSVVPPTVTSMSPFGATAPPSLSNGCSASVAPVFSFGTSASTSLPNPFPSVIPTTTVASFSSSSPAFKTPGTGSKNIFTTSVAATSSVPQSLQVAATSPNSTFQFGQSAAPTINFSSPSTNAFAFGTSNANSLKDGSTTVATTNAGYNFSFSAQPTFNFGGPGQVTQSTPMFSVGSGGGGGSSSRRFKHSQRHRPHHR